MSESFDEVPRTFEIFDLQSSFNFENLQVVGGMKPQNGGALAWALQANRPSGPICMFPEHFTE